MFICCIMYLSCTNTDINNNSTLLNQFKNIDFNNRIAKKIRYSETSKFIKLDTAKDAIFAYIDKLIIKNHKIYIMDARARKKVLCFNMAGEHLNNYGKHGKGPGEYIKLRDFDVDTNGDVFIYSANKQNIYQYDANNRFIKAYKQNFYADGFKILSNENFFFIIDPYSSNTDSMICILNPNNNKRKFLYKYNDDDKAKLRIFNYTQPSNNGFLCYIPIRDYFFKFNNSGKLLSGYKINFGSEKLPKKYKYNSLKIKKYNKSYQYINTCPIIYKNYIIGETMNKNADKKVKSIFKYNLNNKKLITEKISMKNFTHKSLYPFLCVHNRWIISFLNLELLKHSRNKNLIPRDIKEYIKNGGYVITFNKLNH